MIKINRNIFSIFLSLYFVCLLNIPFWCEIFKIIQLDRFADLVYLAAMFVGLSALFTVVFNLILVPYLGKIFISILALIAIFATYHMYYFKVVIDLNMIRNVLQTDIHESLDLLSINFGIWFLLTGIPLFSLCFLKIIYKPRILD